MRILPRWNARDRRVSAVPLACFRVLFGLCLFFDVSALIEYEPMWFDPVPWVERGPAWVAPLLWIWLAATIGLVLGAFTRTCAVLNYLGCVTFMSFNAMPRSYEYHLDNLYIVTSFVLPFLPLARVLSIDALRRPPKTRSIGPGSEIFFALVVSSIYLDSALWKLSSSMWMNGLGYWTVAVQPWDRMPSFAWTIDNEWIARGSGYVVLVFELVFLVLVWFRRIRLPLLAIGFVLHIGIGTFLPIPLFGLIMCSFLVALIPVRAPEERLQDEPAEAPAPSFIRRRLVPAYFGLWALVFTVELYDPIRAIARDGFGGSSTTHQRFWYSSASTPAERWFGASVFWIYRVFGFRSHPIFIDSQFTHYSSQTRLRFHRAEAAEDAAAALEIEGEGETFYPPHRNRRFLALYYRTLWPLIPREHVETRLTRFLAHHAGREGGIDVERGWVTIEQRSIEMPVDRWVHGQHARNEAQPWRRVGVAHGTPGNLEFRWSDPCWVPADG